MTQPRIFADQFAKGFTGYVLCVACHPLGHCRLGISGEDLLPTDTGLPKTVTKVRCPKDYEGGPGVAHGGWTASVLDEMFGHLALIVGKFTVTGTLTVEYIKPVPVDCDLEGVAWVESIVDGKWSVAGELKLASNGKILSRAHGLFIQRDASHFKKHEEWMAAQEKG
jgi:hypothetical protein